MKPPRFDYVRAATIDEAVAVLAEHEGEAKPIAGGQSLMPMLAFRLAAPRVLVDIGRLPGLDGIKIDTDGAVHLGALTRWRDIERDKHLATAHPLLTAAIAHVAHYQIRNRGTVGGSLAHADPAAELPGIAVACDGKVGAFGPNGTRMIAAADFFTGALMTALEPAELITGLHLPPWPVTRRWAFQEFARRRGDFAMAGVALFYDRDADGRARAPHVGVIGVADRPLRLKAVEDAIAGRAVSDAVIAEAGAAAREAVNPEDDIHAPADYRRALTATLVERALAEAASRPAREAA